MDIIEQVEEWRKRYESWQQGRGPGAPRNELGKSYPFVENRRAPFVPARRALPMLNLALITSAGAYIDGTDPFDTNARGGDASFREIPVEVEPEDIRFTSWGYDSKAVEQDINSQVPVQRLSEFQSNGIIGKLNSVYWSFMGFIPDATRVAEELAPRLIERLVRYEVQAALLIPASHLCHQSVAVLARALEQQRIPTMMLAVERDVLELVRPPRAGYYDGEFGSVAGLPNFPEHQRRLLDEALRWIEPLDQPTVRKLAVELESRIERDRGER